MEIAKHDKGTKVFIKRRGKYITHRPLEKPGHPAAKYHSYSVRVDCLKKQSSELFIPPNSTDGTNLKGPDCSTATHTVAILSNKEITMKGFLVDSMDEYMDTIFFKQETSDSVIQKPEVLLHDRMKGVDLVATIL
eukprot:11344851-Ditylum_brightwellii.AAC.1